MLDDVVVGAPAKETFDPADGRGKEAAIKGARRNRKRKKSLNHQQEKFSALSCVCSMQSFAFERVAGPKEGARFSLRIYHAAHFYDVRQLTNS